MKFRSFLALTFSLFIVSSHISLANTTVKITDNNFNPAISLILDGRYTDLDHEELELPGFQLGGEAGLAEPGFSTAHNELALSAYIDDKFYGSATIPIIYTNGETEVELEEIYIETLGLGHGLSLKAGKFYSSIGYLNSHHDHAHDFTDRPLVYDAFFGGHLVDTGLLAQWLAPTPFYLNLGLEVTRGSEFPGGENKDNNEGRTLFIKTGGDLGSSASWQLGLSYFSTEFDQREAGAHHHGDEEHEGAENLTNDGEVEISGIDFIYKWAPNGNAKESNLKIQGEYFIRDEQGRAEFSEEGDAAQAQYDGEHTGYYLQAVYQLMRHWSVGIRYDSLSADNEITQYNSAAIALDEFLEEANYAEVEDDPSRYTLMLSYAPSHFSRIRLQYGSLDNGLEENDIFSLQYIMSLGSHGAHRY